MSDPATKARMSRVKDIKQGLPQRDRIKGKKKKIHKPFRVERRYIHNEYYSGWLFHNDWRLDRLFATYELAMNYIEKSQREFSPRTIRFRIIEGKTGNILYYSFVW